MKLHPANILVLALAASLLAAAPMPAASTAPARLHCRRASMRSAS